MEPFYLTGFTDGEGTFSVSFNKRGRFKSNLETRPSFSISQNKRSLLVLKQIRDYFGVGSIRYSKKDRCYKYEVRSVTDLKKKIIPHFRKYVLKTNKAKDFSLFAEIVDLVATKHHLNPKYLRLIVDKAYQMNGSGKRKYSKNELLKLITR